MNAREYFENAESIIRRYVSTEEHYSELCASDIKGVSYEGSGSHGTRDPMARIDAAVDYIKVVNERSKQAAIATDAALDILYGIDGRSGLAKLKGNIYADVLAMHYLQLYSWGEIARNSDIYTRDQIRSYASAGLRYIDRRGFAYVREGGKREN